MSVILLLGVIISASLGVGIHFICSKIEQS